ncbi:MAG: hypothetical protein NTV75_01680 [Bacteroidia bacterium]|nr:hypothetical protein [Bacteroidia bacterium]
MNLNEPNGLWEILKIGIPALIVFLTAYFMFRDMIENNQKQREMELQLKNSKLILPIKLQAYERLILLLERISPQSLLMRISPHDLNVVDYQQELLSQIRHEFEHNLSQQIYVSQILWETIRRAKENLVQIINNSADEFKNDAPALVLSNKIIENYLESNDQLIANAVNTLKKEFSKLG